MLVMLTYQQEIHESDYGRPLPPAPWLVVAVYNSALWLGNSNIDIMYREL